MADNASTEQVGKYNRDALERILKFSLTELVAGLLLYVSRWETGDIKYKGRKYKNKREAQLVRDYLKMRKEYKYGIDVVNVPDETRERVFQTLVDLGAAVHYDIVSSHRRAIKRTAEILVECEAIPVILPAYLRHDLSKYGPFEVIGYSVMFSSTRNIQKLNGVALEEWNKSVQAHYRDNPHHPEFWGKNNMAEEDLTESIVDMLACRLERDFKWREESAICKNDGKFVKRYTDSDCKLVEERMEDYHRRAVTYLG